MKSQFHFGLLGQLTLSTLLPVSALAQTENVATTTIPTAASATAPDLEAAEAKPETPLPETAIPEATAPETAPPETAASETAAPEVTAPEESTSADITAREDARQKERSDELKRVEKLYSNAAKLLGGEHVILSASAYLGQDCIGCDEDHSGGAAAILSVPLVGVGGGHGLDWYPTLQTEVAEKAFATFEKNVQNYVDFLTPDRIEKLKDPTLARDTLKSAAAELFKELERQDSHAHQLVSTVLGCIEGFDETKPSEESYIDRVFWHADYEDVSSLETICEPLEKARNEKAEKERESTASATKPKHGVDVAETALSESKKLAKATGMSNVITAEIKILRMVLKKYWKRVSVKEAGSVRPEASLKRHNILLGPAIGIPVTEDPTSKILVGGLLELGVSEFRFGISGGFQIDYSQVTQDPGWFTGLAVSGAFGDDLFHLLNDGSKAAASLR